MLLNSGCLGIAFSPQAAASVPERVNISSGWSFHRGEAAGGEIVDFDDAAWEGVALPHTAKIEPLVVNDQWQGQCWYRKTFAVPPEAAGKIALFEFEGAMSRSTFWLNGKLIKERSGGFLPVVFDATDAILPGSENVLAVRLENTDNPLTGPKPLPTLDFNTNVGLYRHAHLTFKQKVRISHPVLAGRVAGGGVFATFPGVSPTEAVVEAKTHVINGNFATRSISVVQRLSVPSPKLWSPSSPNLYSLQTDVLVGEGIVDRETTRIGIREIAIKDKKLFVNGEETFLRGVNRHQEYPFIGYALSDNAQYRDAKKIKEAGFNYIRLSHYPQSPAFMDACDELGLLVLDAIMGWQYYLEDERFKDYCYRSATELVRRDRNHPSVLAWEVSLNETTMPIPFMEELHRIVHVEIPDGNVYTAGWMDEVYDIYLQARQHRIMRHAPPTHPKPYMVSEYGDWEYYSNNAGLNQHKLSRAERLETSSRQLRAFGEQRLQQQAYNLQESHNDNLSTTAFGDSYWVMFDYNRGYSPDLESSGIMDIFRLPKFSYAFYKSQQDPGVEAVVGIANYWTPESALDLKVFSNCDEVELRLNNRLIGRQKPDTDKNTTRIPHPPFTFKIAAFEPGNLEAIGYNDGQETSRHHVRTQGEAVGLKVWLDESGKPPDPGPRRLRSPRIAR